MSSAIFSDLDIMSGAIQDVDIMGDDAALVLESLGAADLAADARKLALARSVDPRAKLVQQQIYKNMALQPAGVTEVSFAGAVTQDVLLNVTRPFKPEDLVVGSDIAPFFLILSCTINGRDQLAGSGPIVCQGFTEVATRAKLRFETVNPSSAMKMSVKHLDAATRTFRANFHGWALLR